ncbi:amino acid/amide ABC transporter membrane protein 2 (HAAT family) /amino acid/amide ABC transporter ATP-binding protein 1 (HAAT family) [Paraburkholderia silvatlantica]|uniref:Amino acid/amide ABC transporter membrane protein 2 (HAAT family) /amino acid/amide ABC transporter ATP-binding protein 1 (HAAT family) n=2 Tax=Paraburkholderia silvatlantica TaxID=321895 RepID=A0A2V4T583_9BURK|nr:amino acid/amide ABC transporter membrane protein 2 (HAAT family) /amino acid/amide ABC transporter ATP-binding protein 1 (HAAT family) [Paraburkholderia silvatlantica]
MADPVTTMPLRNAASSSWKAPFSFGVVALLLLAVCSITLPTFLVNNLIRAFLYAAVALTVDLLWGYTGILTFGQSAFFGIGAYAAGLVFTHAGFSFPHAAAALAAGLVAAWIVSRAVGWLAFYHGASPLFASVVTLVLPIVLVQGIYSGGEFTGSSSGLSGFDSFDIPLEAWFFIAGASLILLTVAAWMFVRSDAGRLLVAIRENEARCEYLGINVSRYKARLMDTCAVIASFAGFLFACVQMVVAPEYAGFVFGTELVIWVALGGRGSLIGPTIGAMSIDVGSAYLSGNLPYVWTLLVGVAFVVVIVAMPRGLGPLVAGAARQALPRRRLAAPPVVFATAPPRDGNSADHTADSTTDNATGNAGPALSLRNVQKHFGSLKVLDDIGFDAHAGELLSLIGPNGAGKSTLMRCIADGAERSGGTVEIGGTEIRTLAPYDCVALGVGRKFQTATVFESLSVAEALRIARYRVAPPSQWRRDATLELPQPALDVLRLTGLDRIAERECRYLSHGQKQALELAMVLALEPRTVLLDEPTAGLTKQERTQIGEIFVALSTRYLMCLLLVEHDLDFVQQISTRIVVLHQGRIVMDGGVDEVVNSELVRAVYAGETHSAANPSEREA